MEKLEIKPPQDRLKIDIIIRVQGVGEGVLGRPEMLDQPHMLACVLEAKIKFVPRKEILTTWLEAAIHAVDSESAKCIRPEQGLILEAKEVVPNGKAPEIV